MRKKKKINRLELIRTSHCVNGFLWHWLLHRYTWRWCHTWKTAVSFKCFRVYLFNFEKKTTYHWVTGVDIYITVLLWFGIYLWSYFFFYFFFILQIYISNEILCFLIPLNVHLTYSYLDTEQNIIWNVYTFIISLHIL